MLDMQTNSSQAPFRRRPSRVQGPRPCSTWSLRSSSTESSEEWGWTYGGHDSRLSLCSSSTSSSTTDCSSAFDDAQSWSGVNYSHRRKPAGPRSPRRPRAVGLKKALVIDALARLDEAEFPQTMEVDLEVIPRSNMSKAPALVPSPPTNNFLLDWDLIFRVLCLSDPSQDGQG